MKLLFIEITAIGKAKLAAIILMILLPGTNLFGQIDNSERNYILGAGAGYNFSLAGGNLGTNILNENTQGIYGSWAQGMLANIDLGMRTCQNFYTMVSLNYLNGRNIESSTMYDSDNSSYQVVTQNHLKIPVLVTLGGRYYIDLDRLSFIEGGGIISNRIEPYLGAGIGFAFGSYMKNTTTTESVVYSNEYTLETNSTIKFKPTHAFYGELGLSYKASDRLSVFAGVKGNSMSLLNSRGKLNSYIENGEDHISDLSVIDIETEYVKNWYENEVEDPNKPSKLLAERHPVSGLSFSIGVLYDIAPLGGNLPKLPRGGKGLKPLKPKVNMPQPGIIKKSSIEKYAVEHENASKNCKDCPSTKLEVISNNPKSDSVDFPKDQTIELRGGKKPWGKVKLEDLEIIRSSVKAGCGTCPSSDKYHCCWIDSMQVKLIFRVYLNTKKINNGVWMNTDTSDQENIGRTITKRELPENIDNPQDWKRVDVKSVEIHERQHIKDMEVLLKKALVEELKKVEVIQVGASEAGKRRCTNHIRINLLRIEKNLKRKAKEKAKEIATQENDDYSRDNDLEQKARLVQAKYLNKGE